MHPLAENFMGDYQKLAWLELGTQGLHLRSSLLIKQ